MVTLIATGLSNDEIAGQLYVSASTVKTHAGRAMTKLAARDRAQLVVAAYETGLVLPGRYDCPMGDVAGFDRSRRQVTHFP